MLDETFILTLISGNHLDFLVAADTVDDLVHYNVYSCWQCSRPQRAIAQQLLDRRVVYFLDANIKARLLDCNVGYVRVELMEDAAGKHKGDICWVHRSNTDPQVV